MPSLLARARQWLLRAWNPPRHQGAFLTFETIHLARAYYVAAALGVADLLHEHPRSCADLADLVEADSRELNRVLRALAAFGVFRLDAHGLYHHTSRADVLLSDSPASLRSWFLLLGSPAMWQTFSKSLDAVKTGTHAFRLAHGRDFYAHLEEDDSLRQAFLSAMNGWTQWQAKALVSEFSFASYGKVADIGGGLGALLREILLQNPSARGLLFDRAETLQQARAMFEAQGLSERCEFVAGDFLQQIPAGADAYVVKHVLRDWDDQHVVAILRNCRAAMRPDASLLVIDAVLDPRNGRDRLAKLVDLEIGTLQAGRFRTRDELQELLTEAGFDMQRIYPTTVLDSSIVVARPAVR